MTVVSDVICKVTLSNYLVTRRLSGKSYQATLQYCSSSPNTGSNSGGGRIQKKNPNLLHSQGVWNLPDKFHLYFIFVLKIWLQSEKSVSTNPFHHSLRQSMLNPNIEVFNLNYKEWCSQFLSRNLLQCFNLDLDIFCWICLNKQWYHCRKWQSSNRPF